MNLTRALIVSLVCHGASLAYADNQSYGPYSKSYVEDCGSCHVPYPPQRMTQQGWETQMGNLSQHYGTDASLDAAAAKPIMAYLTANAGIKPKLAPTGPTARLTETRWFVGEHGKAPAGKSFSDCTQCHKEAAQGDFSERRLQIPANWRMGR